MSKHVKELRRLAVYAPSQAQQDSAYAAADHMEKLEAQLRIAKKVLTDFKNGKWSCGLTASHEAADALAAMRQAGRKK